MSFRSLAESTNLLIGAAYLAVSLLLIYEARRLRIGTPPLLLLLVAFFAVLGLGRLADPDPLLGSSPVLAGVLGVASLLVLVVVAANARRIARAVLQAFRDARGREREYERARGEYAQLVRHRMFNPLTVIRGAAQTLQSGAADGAARDELLRAIVEATEELERVTLEPERRSAAESDLDAVPRVES
jgi:signal transduction histidine kinase